VKLIKTKENLVSNTVRLWQLEATIVNIMQHFSIVSKKPFIVKYYPKYKASVIGGRLFEVNGGVQNLPSEVKKKSLVGINYDVISSQLNIVKSIYKSLSKSTITIKSVDDVASKLKVERKLAKVILYATIFSAGIISESKYSALHKAIKKKGYSDKSTILIIRRWKIKSISLVRAIKTILSHYKSKSKRGFINNAVGIRVSSTINSKKLLAHIIQGEETKFLMKVVLKNKSIVSALEHDGFLAHEPIASVSYRGLGTESSSNFADPILTGANNHRSRQQAANSFTYTNNAVSH
jgi:hypothetical protein